MKRRISTFSEFNKAAKKLQMNESLSSNVKDANKLDKFFMHVTKNSDARDEWETYADDELSAVAPDSNWAYLEAQEGDIAHVIDFGKELLKKYKLEGEFENANENEKNEKAKDYDTKDVNIDTIKIGDTVFHDGFVRTVGKESLKHDKFIGTTLWGDSYRLGSKPVKLVIFKKPKTDESVLFNYLKKISEKIEMERLIPKGKVREIYDFISSELKKGGTHRTIDWNETDLLKKWFFDYEKHKEFYHSAFNKIITGHQDGKSVEDILSDINMEPVTELAAADMKSTVEKGKIYKAFDKTKNNNLAYSAIRFEGNEGDDYKFTIVNRPTPAELVISKDDFDSKYVFAPSNFKIK